MLHTCRVISIIFFYQMCGILFYFWYVINMAGREISTIGDFIKMNFRPIPDYIERRAVARSKTQQAFGYAFCFRKNKKGGKEREREREKKKRERRRKRKQQRDTPLHRPVFFRPAKTEIALFFPPFSIPLGRSIDRGIQFTNARDHIAFIELEKFPVS